MDLHIVGIARGSILLVGCNVDDLPSGDGKILIILGVPSANFWAFGVERDGYLSTGLHLFGLTGVILQAPVSV